MQLLIYLADIFYTFFNNYKIFIVSIWKINLKFVKDYINLIFAFFCVKSFEKF